MDLGQLGFYFSASSNSWLLKFILAHLFLYKYVFSHCLLYNDNIKVKKQTNQPKTQVKKNNRLEYENTGQFTWQSAASLCHFRGK